MDIRREQMPQATGQPTKLMPEERLSAVAQKIRALVEYRVMELRQHNDVSHPMEKTEHLRGGISELQLVMHWLNPNERRHDDGHIRRGDG